MLSGLVSARPQQPTGSSTIVTPWTGVKVRFKEVVICPRAPTERTRPGLCDGHVNRTPKHTFRVSDLGLLLQFLTFICEMGPRIQASKD